MKDKSALKQLGGLRLRSMAARSKGGRETTTPSAEARSSADEGLVEDGLGSRLLLALCT